MTVSLPSICGFDHDVAGAVDDERIVAESADHGVVAGSAIERVVAVFAVEHVVVGQAEQRVVLVAAEQGVLATVALERVVAVLAFQHVDAVVAPQLIVMGGTDEVFDAVELVALGVAAGGGAVDEDDSHDRFIGLVVGCGIDAGAAVQGVLVRRRP